MNAGSSIEILQGLRKRPQEKEDEAAAAQNLLSEYENYQQQLSTIDKDALLSEWDLIKSDKSFPNFENPKLEHALKVSSKVSQFEEIEHLLHITLLNIHALSLFVQNLEREQVLQHVSSKPWIEQHEILTRWAWMTIQREEKQKERSFNHLYLCRVGSRVRRQNLDREFDTFRMFLPHFCGHTEREYLFYQKLQSPNDPPDFVAVDEHRNQIGIEITEAPLDEKSSFEEKQREIVVGKLMEDFKQLKYTLTIWSRPTWAELRDNYDKLKEWIANLISNSQLSLLDEIERFSRSDLKLHVSMSRSKYEFIVFDGSGEGSGQEYYGDIVEQKVSESSCKALFKKVNNSDHPKVKPCVLVIYENTSLPAVDYKKVTDLISEKLNFQRRLFYEQVWLVDDQKGICILQN